MGSFGKARATSAASREASGIDGGDVKRTDGQEGRLVKDLVGWYINVELDRNNVITRTDKPTNSHGETHCIGSSELRSGSLSCPGVSSCRCLAKRG